MDIWKEFVFLVSNEHEIYLVTSITNTIKENIHSFGYALYNCVSDDTIGENFVELN